MSPTGSKRLGPTFKPIYAYAVHPETLRRLLMAQRAAEA